MRRAAPRVLFLTVALAAACGKGPSAPAVAARPATVTPQHLDSLWTGIHGMMEDKKWGKAALAAERYLLLLPFGDPRIPRARMLLGEAYLGDRSNLLAVREFRQVADLYPTDSLAPEALLRAGDAYALLWRRPELDPTDAYSAMTVYEELMARYPAAPAAERGKAAIATLQEKFAVKELRSAEYYIKYKAYDSAIIYLRNVIATWPTAKVVPDVLTRLVETYRVLGYTEDIQEVCTYFRAQWPLAPRLSATCPQPVTAGPPPTGG